MSFSINKQIKAAHQEHRDRMGYLKTYMSLYAALLRQLQKAKVNIVHVSLGWKTLNLSIAGDYEMLLRTMRVFRSRGMDAYKRPQEGEASYHAYWTAKYDEDSEDWDKSCSYENEEDMRVFLNFTSTQCERIQVGTKLEEVPVYEVRCKD
jgi:hypothetical protein